MVVQGAKDHLTILEEIGSRAAAEIDLAEAAQALAYHHSFIAAKDGAAKSTKEEDIISFDTAAARYRTHIQKLCDGVGARYLALIEEGAQDNAGTKLAALKFVLCDSEGYIGDSESYDDLQNVNLMKVIDRRKGMPIALSLLYIHVAEAQGWRVAALNFPAHVICRLEDGAARVLFDPFQGCQLMQAADLRALLKKLVNPQAELSASFYEPATKREVLVRLQNNIKLRQIEAEDYKGAVDTIEMMRLIAPDEYRLLLDAGVLYARIGRTQEAVDALEDYIDATPSPEDQHEALLLLQQIRLDG